MKVNLSTIGSGYGATSALNANFDAIEAAIENTLSRDGTTPNEMEANLDMNDNNILNVGALDVASLTINGTPVQPSTGVTVASAFQSYTFTATAGQTSFSVSPYTPYVASVQVEVNGLSLPPADISVSGTNVVIPACSAGDEVVIRRYTDAPSPFPSASDISFNQAGTVQTRTVQSKLRDVVSVKDFGAVGDGVTDDTAAIQAFFNALAATAYDKAVLSGNLKISSKVSLVNSLTKTIDCNAIITSVFTAEDEMVLFKDTPYLKLVGRLEVVGSGSSTYSTRTNGVGIKVNNCLRFSGDYVRAAYFKYKGVQIENGSTEGGGNSSLWAFERLRLEECGAGLANTVRGVRKNFTARTDNGSSGSLAQTTTLTLDSVPTGLEQYSLCKIGTTVCALTAAPSGNTVTVFPWPDTSLSTGTVDFYIGGGLYVKGGDTSVGEIKTLDAVGCSVAYNAMSLYPASIQNFVSQANGIGLAIGRGGNTSSVGGQIDSAYFELCDFDIVKPTVAIVSFNIDNALITDFTKVIGLSPRLTGNTISTTYNALRGVSLRVSGKTIEDRPILVSSARTLTFDQKPGFIESLRANTATVTIASVGEGSRLYNNTDAAILVVGSGTNNRPTGVVTFTPPASVAINGGTVGANVAFSGFSGPCLFYIRADSDTAYTVQRCDFDALISGSATYDPPSLADGAGATTTVTVTGAALGDYATASFSLDLQGITVTAWVSATDTVSVRFQNETGGPLDLGSGTLRVRVSKA